MRSVDHSLTTFFSLSIPFLLLCSVLNKVGVPKEKFPLAVLIVAGYVYLVPVFAWLIFVYFLKFGRWDEVKKKFRIEGTDWNSIINAGHLYVTYTLGVACIIIHIVSWFS